MQVAEATAAELSAGARLRELLAGLVPPSSQEGVAALAAAIAAAEPFSSLSVDVDAARELHQQSCARAEVAAQLQDVVDKVSRLASRVSLTPGSSGSSGGGAAPADGSSGNGSNVGCSSSSDGVLGLPLQGFSLPEWQQYVAWLEAAVEPAKDAKVSMTKVWHIHTHIFPCIMCMYLAAVLETASTSSRTCAAVSDRSAQCWWQGQCRLARRST
jgi:hypothetical protein